MKFHDFLNPKSMITPGIAGGLIMIIANTLWVEFAISKTWSSLFLSFLLVVLTLKNFSASNVEKFIYWIFNSLIIFSLAVNANFTGREISKNKNLKNMSFVNQHPGSGEIMVGGASAGLVSHLPAANLLEANQNQVFTNSTQSNHLDVTKKERNFFDPYF